MSPKLIHVNMLKAWEPWEDIALYGVEWMRPNQEEGNRGSGPEGEEEPISQAATTSAAGTAGLPQSNLGEARDSPRMANSIPTAPCGVVVWTPICLIPWVQKKELEQEVAKMLDLKVISPWRNPPVLVTKPDGTIRFYIDFRRLNMVSMFDANPMPWVHALLDLTEEACFLSTTDLTKGYWQILLAPEDQEKTAFAMPLGSHHFLKMLFGRHGAAASFNILAPIQDCAAAYIDGILVLGPRPIEPLTGV